jgi:ADP-heptose:LPS heptosyltransferase
MNLVVKVPNDLREKLLSFPLLHVLHREFSQDADEENPFRFHIISNKKGIDVLNLLPFEAFYHQVDNEDNKNIFRMHRACANFKINDVDIFINTTEGFVDTSIGKNLGAKTCIGFDVGKNSWILNKKSALPVGHHESDKIYTLAQHVLDEVPEIPLVKSRELPPIYADYQENPYVVINLNLVKGEIEREWIDLIELFVNKNIIFMCSELEKHSQEPELKRFIEELPQKNNYKTFILNSNIDFAKLIAHSVCFVTHDSPLMHIASYCRAHTFYINKKENLQKTGPEHFTGKVRNFSLSDPTFQSAGKPNYSKIFDEVFEFVEERTKKEEESESEDTVK